MNLVVLLATESHMSYIFFFLLLLFGTFQCHALLAYGN